jgi:predicted RecA/RadA family phage recombinase
VASIEQYSGKLIEAMMGTNGTAGDLVYLSTGSFLTNKSASTGTSITTTFTGVLVDTAAKGSMAVALCDGVVQLEKHTSTNKIEAGNAIYGTKSSNKVGTLAGGTAIGFAVKQSATDDTYVSVRIQPFWVSGAGGFKA